MFNGFTYAKFHSAVHLQMLCLYVITEQKHDSCQHGWLHNGLNFLYNLRVLMPEDAIVLTMAYNNYGTRPLKKVIQIFQFVGEMML